MPTNAALSTLEEALKRPFRDEDIEWRVQKSGLKKNGQPLGALPLDPARSIAPGPVFA